jgi:uncharacterized membrane protein HdeD (DUF308 family)
MSEVTEKGRTGGDLVLGGLLVVLGIIILGDAVVATTLSLLFIGWLLLIGGLVTLAGTLFLIGRDGFWMGAIGGGLMTVLGLVCLRHTDAAAVTLTLVAGAMFLTSGIARLMAATQIPEARVALIISGGVSTVLGLIVLFNLMTISLAFLGIILGIQVLAEGIAIMVVGRHALTTARTPGGLAAPPV